MRKFTLLMITIFSMLWITSVAQAGCTVVKQSKNTIIWQELTLDLNDTATRSCTLEIMDGRNFSVTAVAGAWGNAKLVWEFSNDGVNFGRPMREWGGTENKTAFVRDVTARYGRIAVHTAKGTSGTLNLFFALAIMR